MTGTVHIPGLPPGWKPEDLTRVIRQLMAGKFNAVTTVTLTADATTTTLSDPRITAESFLGFTPLTADARAEGIPSYVATDGEAELTHDNDESGDRDFAVLIVG